MHLILLSIIGFFLAVGGLWLVMRIAIHSIHTMEVKQQERDEENAERLRTKREEERVRKGA